MKTLRVEAGKPYNVHIGPGAIETFSAEYQQLLDSADQVAIIADEKVASLHLGSLLASLEPYRIRVLTVPAGEGAKSVEVFMECHSFLLKEGFSRKSLLLAFGGGAVGDVAGFVASTFMRGIPFIQVPTTILAHDSAVGGKTAINHPLGKNMIGTFYQPEAVVYDLNFLHTLPPHEIRSGMAEVIKHAFISNEDWLDELLEIETMDRIPDSELMQHLERGIAVKAAIVEEDEFEGGVRKYLNFGHTLAHAMEAHLGYGAITHGEAVAIGMGYALLLSGHERVEDYLIWCKKNHYPLEKINDIPFGQVLDYMRKDKKSSRGALRFVLLEETGVPFMETIEEERAKTAYAEYRSMIREVLV